MYYHDLWEKRIQLIKHLMDLVAKFGHTKITHKNNIKKYCWNDIDEKAFIFNNH